MLLHASTGSHSAGLFSVENDRDRALHTPRSHETLTRDVTYHLLGQAVGALEESHRFVPISHDSDESIWCLLRLGIVRTLTRLIVIGHLWIGERLRLLSTEEL